jgi:hypothetical protein
MQHMPLCCLVCHYKLTLKQYYYTDTLKLQLENYIYFERMPSN